LRTIGLWACAGPTAAAKTTAAATAIMRFMCSLQRFIDLLSICAGHIIRAVRPRQSAADAAIDRLDAAAAG
jgi:hypothetical protein